MNPLPDSRPLRFAVFLVLLLVPLATAQEAHPAPPMDTTLWLHVDGLQDFGMTTQPPPADFAADYGIGSLTHSNSCILGPPLPPLLYGSHHTWYGVPGLTTYRDGPDLQARGIAYDLDLDNATRPELVWHLRSDLLPTREGTPAAVPEVVLRGTLREGHAVSVDHRALDTGRLLAQATSEPALLAPTLEGHPQVTHHEAGGSSVYTFRLPLDWATEDTHVGADVALNLRVDVYVQAPLCDRPDEAYLMPDAFSVHTSPEHRPTLTLGVRNPLWVERLEPVPTDDGVRLYARVASPWGPHDTVPPLLEPSPGASAGALLGERGVQPLEPTLWSWNVTPSPDAPTQLHVTGASLQGASADATALFELGTGRVVACHGPGPDACRERPADAPDDRGAPAPWIAGTLLALALAARATRQGQKRL